MPLTPEEAERLGLKPPTAARNALTPEEARALGLKPPPNVSKLESFGRGVAQGASGGFVDELGGVGTAIGDMAHRVFGDRDPSLPAPPSAVQSYREGRDEHRADDKKAEDAHKYLYGGGQLLGGVATALVPGAKGADAVARIGQAAKAGGAFAAGSSEADLTKGQVPQFVRDVAVGSAVGGAVGGAGELLKKGVGWAADKIGGSLSRRVMNEVAEGSASTTQTARKQLNKAEKNIVKEVVHGPDADDVRGAYQGGSATKGQERLAPIIKKIEEKRVKAYDAFAKAGRAAVDVDAYAAMLTQAEKAVRGKGKSSVADGIRAFREKVISEAKETGGLTLEQLRGLTTEAQNHAASALGSLNEHTRAATLKMVERPVTAAMDKVLSNAARGVPALEKAAQQIRNEINPRLNALLTINKALARRAEKEASAKSGLVRVAERIAPSAATGAALGAMGSEDRIEGALMGAAAGSAVRAGIPALARGIDNKITTAVIRAAQGQPTITRAAAEKVAQGIGRIGGGVAASKLPPLYSEDPDGTPRIRIPWDRKAD
jgi:hypothetical protein